MESCPRVLVHRGYGQTPRISAASQSARSQSSWSFRREIHPVERLCTVPHEAGCCTRRINDCAVAHFPFNSPRRRASSTEFLKQEGENLIPIPRSVLRTVRAVCRNQRGYGTRLLLSSSRQKISSSVMAICGKAMWRAGFLRKNAQRSPC